MNILTTFCRPSLLGPNCYDVHWRNGNRYRGMVTVTVKGIHPDADVVAELSALQWLLGHRAIFGVAQSGKGLVLKVTAGAIKKAANALGSSGTSRFCKTHVLPYARFLSVRYAGVVIEVAKDNSWISDCNAKEVARLEISKPLGHVFDIPSIGLVEISEHAISRFRERLCMVNAEDVWRLLRRVVTGPLRRAQPNRDAISRQIVKHGEAGERWVNDSLKWQFVLVHHADRSIIVTAYAM